MFGGGSIDVFGGGSVDVFGGDGFGCVVDGFGDGSQSGHAIFGPGCVDGLGLDGRDLGKGDVF